MPGDLAPRIGIVVEGDAEWDAWRRFLAGSAYEVLRIPATAHSAAACDCVLLSAAPKNTEPVRLLAGMQGPDRALSCAVIIIGSGADVRLAAEVMKAGALDYLPAETLDRTLVERSIDDARIRFRRNCELNRRAREHAHLAALIAASSDAIVSLGTDGRRVRSWSKGAEVLFGYSEAEAIGSTIDDLIIPEFKNCERLRIFDATSQGRSLVVETERRHKSGKLVPVEINVSPMPSGYAVIFRDIRERRRIEHEARQSQLRLAAREAELTRAQRIAKIGSYEVECRDGRFVNRRSPEYLAIHGLPPESADEPHEAWVRRMHPEDREMSERCFKTAMMGCATEYEAEYRIIRPSDGDIRWIRVLAEIDRDSRGAPIRLFGTHIDVTERKLAEEALKASEARLRLATQAARLGPFEIDWKTQRRHWSQELRDLLAVPEDADISLVTDLVDRIIPLELLHEFRDRLAPSLDPAGTQEFEHEQEVTRLDGSKRFVLMRGCTLLEDSPSGPRPSRTVGLIMDITERKKAERQRELLLRELDHRLKNVFATVSSMIGLSARSADNVADYAASLRERLYALSAVHNLVRGADLDNSASLTAITRAISTTGLQDKIVARGPDVIVSAATAIALGMILNELLTNAIKYGALSAVGGAVELNWTIDADRFLMRWQESGGPRVATPTRTGFGSRMILQNANVLEGRVTTEWRADGIAVTLACPRSVVRG